MLWQKAKIENGKMVIVDSKVVNQSELTNSCWAVQIEGLSDCQDCKYQGISDCEGKGIIDRM